MNTIEEHEERHGRLGTVITIAGLAGLCACPLAAAASAEARQTDEVKAHLLRYTAFERSTPRDALIRAMEERYGDFQLPGRLDLTPEQQERFTYSMDHLRHRLLYAADYPRAAKWIAGALRDLWLRYGDRDARGRYVLLLRHVLAQIDTLGDADLLAKIDEQGTRNPWHFHLKEACWQYAELYRASGDERCARRVCLILGRLGEVVGQWQVHYRNESAGGTQTGSATVGVDPVRKLGYGLWGRWGHVHDLTAARPLVDAYAAVRDSRSFADLPAPRQRKIVHGLLHTLAQKHLVWPYLPGLNMNLGRLKGLVHFGRTLGEPAYIHRAVEWYDETLHHGFFRDGVWRQNTVSYGYHMAKTWAVTVPEMLKGYSDPPGYVDAEDGTRFDNLDLSRRYSETLKRMKKVFTRLSLPNERSAAIHDTKWDDTRCRFEPDPQTTRPFLLGAAGNGMLGFGQGAEQVRLFLHWGDNNVGGHGHWDCLNMFLWACGQEISCETAYRGRRQWNRSTAAHNTVVVDGVNQDRSEAWGRVILWDTTDPEIQVAEAEAADTAYKATTVYQRTLALVRVEEHRFYILDIFRVTGGGTHDWMLHGNLEKRYDVTLAGTDADLPALVQREGKLGEYLDNLRAAPEGWDKDAVAEFSAGDGATLRSTIAGLPGTELILADGPAIRLGPEPDNSYLVPDGKGGKVKWEPTDDTSLFLCVRRRGPENVFVAVHEAYADRPCVEMVEFVGRSGLVRVEIQGRGHVDTITSQDGTLSYRRLTDGTPTKEVSFGARPIEGRILAIRSVDRGDGENAFTVEGRLPQGNRLTGQVIILIDGQGGAHPYIIRAVEPVAEDRSDVTVTSETGLTLAGDTLVTNFSPRRRVPGTVRFTIPSKMESAR